MPDEFWDYNAIDCAELLAGTRCREQPDGTIVSVGEKFDGKRPNLSKRRVWGCLVVAKKYPRWVQGKLDDRGVVGVNLGRSRTRPGYVIWSPEYGVFTSKHVVFYETEFPFKDGSFALGRRSTGGGATTGGGGVHIFAPASVPTAEDDESGDEDNDDDEDDDESDDDDDGDEGNTAAESNFRARLLERSDPLSSDAESDAEQDDGDGEVQSGSGAGGDKYDEDANLLDDEDSEASSAEITPSGTSDHDV
jgi:hypothetical protein